jgi:hypothetical protein
LSIEFGIARTFALGVGFYAVCALMVIVSRQTSRMGVSDAGPVEQSGLPRQVEVAFAAAPSIQPAQIELAAMPSRAGEAAE